jgi:CubicO group peptidase (beta-lactamase class C family)
MPANARIDGYLEAQIRTGQFPGAGYVVAEAGRVLAAGSLGLAVIDPERIPASADTLYDLASLTKPLAGALLAVVLQAEGRLRLEDRLSRHLPAWDAPDERGGITLLDLLTHRSGLPAWLPLYAHAGDRDGRIDYLKAVPLAYVPRTGVAYSCPGYILLGYALEQAGGATLDVLFSGRVARRLGLADLMFGPPAALRRRTAATEEGNARERSLAGPQGDRYNGWRGEMIWGEVHDNNAHSQGGISANAGLFGTARSVANLAREFLDGGRLLGEEERLLFRTDFTQGLAEDRSLGFQIASTAGCSAGGSLARTSFGHTGFTGTSLWIDPESRRVYVLLTNRVHPRFREIDMNAIRRGFHDIAATL